VLGRPSGRPSGDPILSAARDLPPRSASTARPSGILLVAVTVRTLRYCHANKEAILTAMLDRSIGSVTRRCDQALAEAGDDPMERLRNLSEFPTLYVANHLRVRRWMRRCEPVPLSLPPASGAAPSDDLSSCWWAPSSRA
jgi:hypothetical protein